MLPTLAQQRLPEAARLFFLFPGRNWRKKSTFFSEQRCGQSYLPVSLEQMASDEQEFDLSMPAVVDKYKSAGTVANGTKSFWNSGVENVDF